jgi:acyl-CoA synthetase (AMP-forming)/AMP-acid ligase II
VDRLIEKGSQLEPAFVEPRFAAGEAKQKVSACRRSQRFLRPTHTQIGFLNFSSGTTGMPKASHHSRGRRAFPAEHGHQAVAISHYAVIANVIQLAAGAGVSYLRNDRPYLPGDVVLGVSPFFRASSVRLCALGQ